jgi:hypothetical protein
MKDHVNGSIIFFETETWYKNIASFIVNITTGEKYTHVGFLYYIENEPFVIESLVMTGRSITNLDTYRGRRYAIVPPPKTWEEKEHKVIDKINQVHYGFADVVLAGLSRAMKRVGIKYTFGNYSGEICSEFVAKVCNIKPSNITPTELLVKIGLDKIVETGRV